MQKLQSHILNPVTKNNVNIRYAKTGNLLVVNFEVIIHDLNTSSHFRSSQFDNFGLWEYDVAEVFIQGQNADNHYLELQCSPLGQYYCLLIKKPRIETQEIKSLDTKITHSYNHETQLFKCQFSIPSTDIPGDFTHLRGNFFACLGKKNAREYYAFNINTEQAVDFHRPDLFVELK